MSSIVLSLKLDSAISAPDGKVKRELKGYDNECKGNRKVNDLQNSWLFREIRGFDHSRKHIILNDQGILGLHHLAATNLRREASKQRLANYHKLELAKELERRLSKIDGLPYSFIKGVTFLNTLYQDFGERFMSDIDLLVKMTSDVRMALKESGFNKRESSNWKGNAHKEEWIHDSGIVLETHEKLFWHLSCDISWEIFESELNEEGLHVPAPNLHFVFLCGHYAFQHTCQKLYWLIDLERFVDFYEDRLDWKEIGELATRMKLRRSVAFSCKLLRHAFGRSLPIFDSSFPVDHDVFFSDQTSFYSLLLKLYLKDRWQENFSYNVFWLLNSLKSNKT